MATQKVSSQFRKFLFLIIFAIIASLLITAIVGFFSYFHDQMKSPTGVACTMEAKLCPDGTSVGRSGPKCEFVACPPVSQELQLCLDSCDATGGQINWACAEACQKGNSR